MLGSKIGLENCALNVSTGASASSAAATASAHGSTDSVTSSISISAQVTGLSAVQPWRSVSVACSFLAPENLSAPSMAAELAQVLLHSASVATRRLIDVL